METVKTRFAKQNEVLPKRQEGQSFMDVIELYNGGKTQIVGEIGKTGSKRHIFDAYYIQLNGENVIYSYNTVCGAESYKSSIIPLDSNSVTCKKCLKKHLK